MDMLNTITVLNKLSRLRGAQRLHHDPRVLEILYRIEAWLSHAGTPGAAEMVGPEVVYARRGCRWPEESEMIEHAAGIRFTAGINTHIARDQIHP